MRLLPLVGILFFIGVGVCLRSAIQRLRFGISGWAIGRGAQPVERALSLLLMLYMALLVAEAAAAAFAPGMLVPFGSFLPGPLVGPAARVGGALLFSATVLMFLAQLGLGASWRIGIDRAHQSPLVTSGIYAWSRNPIYVFMMVALAGFALLLPNWLSLGALVAAAVGVRTHVVYFEEPFLRSRYGIDYDVYAKRVGRFVPGIGRGRSACATPSAAEQGRATLQGGVRGDRIAQHG